jgi:hypothetical protein
MLWEILAQRRLGKRALIAVVACVVLTLTM